MSVPVYIITLASATQRRAFQEAQAQHLGFSPIWHPAMGVNDFSDDIFLQHAFSWQRPLKKTEVGCFLSHLQVWQCIAQSSSPAVVLEDDVILADHWLQVVQQLSDFSGADLINLEAVGKKQLGNKAHTHNSYNLQRLVLNSSGSGAYMLWPQGAAKLLQRYAKHGAALADAFINETRLLSAWQLVPSVVIQQCMLPYYGLPVQEEGASQIAREKFVSPAPPHWWLVLIMRWRRIAGEFRKGVLKLGLLLGHQQQFVPYLHHQRHR